MARRCNQLLVGIHAGLRRLRRSRQESLEVRHTIDKVRVARNAAFGAVLWIGYHVAILERRRSNAVRIVFLREEPIRKAHFIK